MPDTPAWAARAALYLVVGFMVLFGFPFAAWLGKREISRWESKLQKLESENAELRKEVRGLRRDLLMQMEGDHSDVEQKLDTLIEEVGS